MEQSFRFVTTRSSDFLFSHPWNNHKIAARASGRWSSIKLQPSLNVLQHHTQVQIINRYCTLNADPLLRNLTQTRTFCNILHHSLVSAFVMLQVKLPYFHCQWGIILK